VRHRLLQLVANTFGVSSPCCPIGSTNVVACAGLAFLLYENASTPRKLTHGVSPIETEIDSVAVAHCRYRRSTHS